jgi:hypothetical protein
MSCREQLSARLYGCESPGVAAWLHAKHAAFTVAAESYRKLQNSCIAIFCDRRAAAAGAPSPAAAAVTPDAPPRAPGDKVEARFRGGMKWFGGEITACNNADGTVDVLYDDGDRERGVKPEFVRGKGGAAASAAAAAKSSAPPAPASCDYDMLIGLVGLFTGKQRRSASGSEGVAGAVTRCDAADALNRELPVPGCDSVAWRKALELRRRSASLQRAVDACAGSLVGMPAPSILDRA